MVKGQVNIAFVQSVFRDTGCKMMVFFINAIKVVPRWTN